MTGVFHRLLFPLQPSSHTPDPYCRYFLLLQVMGAGMCVAVVGTVRRGGKDVLEVKSEFFYRDGGDNYSNVCISCCLH